MKKERDIPKLYMSVMFEHEMQLIVTLARIGAKHDLGFRQLSAAKQKRLLFLMKEMLKHGA